MLLRMRVLELLTLLVLPGFELETIVDLGDTGLMT